MFSSINGSLSIPATTAATSVTTTSGTSKRYYSGSCLSTLLFFFCPMLTPQSCANLVKSRGFLPRCYTNTDFLLYACGVRGSGTPMPKTIIPSLRTYSRKNIVTAKSYPRCAQCPRDKTRFRRHLRFYPEQHPKEQFHQKLYIVAVS